MDRVLYAIGIAHRTYTSCVTRWLLSNVSHIFEKLLGPCAVFFKHDTHIYQEGINQPFYSQKEPSLSFNNTKFSIFNSDFPCSTKTVLNFFSRLSRSNKLIKWPLNIFCWTFFGICCLTLSQQLISGVAVGVNSEMLDARKNWKMVGLGLNCEINSHRSKTWSLSELTSRSTCGSVYGGARGTGRMDRPGFG